MTHSVINSVAKEAIPSGRPHDWLHVSSTMRTHMSHIRRV